MTSDFSGSIPEFEGIESLAFDDGLHKKLCSMLDRVPLLRDFEFSEIEELANYCNAYKAAKSTLIFREGEKADVMYLLIDGYAALMKGKKHIATVREGRTMGEMSMLDGLPYSATAISAVESMFIIFSRQEFERLGWEQPRLAFKLLLSISQLLSVRLRKTTDLLVDYL